jgi:hypothetical protein
MAWSKNQSRLNTSADKKFPFSTGIFPSFLAWLSGTDDHEAELTEHDFGSLDTAHV